MAVGGGGMAVGGGGMAVGGGGMAVGGKGMAVGRGEMAVGGEGMAVGGAGMAVGAAGKAVEVEWSRLIASIHTVEVGSKSTLRRGHRRSTLGWFWYSGAKSWPEPPIWAYSPPM